MKILVTGAAGFVGFHTSSRLLQAGHEIVGIDNLNSYYDPALKAARLDMLGIRQGFAFERLDLSDRAAVAEIFSKHDFDVVIHLGAQAGVRYSIDNPFAYADSNLAGTLTVLEGCRTHRIKHLVYASSSSVYGANRKQPFSVKDPVDHPVSLYAATKRSNEMMCQSYAHLYGIPITGLRFFTVYGPWGRPDMAYFKFAKAIVEGAVIDVYNHGDMLRDFTYIDDIVDGIEAILEKGPLPPNEGEAPHRLYNLGNNRPERLLDLIENLERLLERPAKKRFLPMQAGDVLATYADITETSVDYGFMPKTDLKTGLAHFSAWFRDFYKAS
ncbi:NAD-dependent epimerase/dehydratase family protein [Luteimonas sp. gir]|uniref:NAD-dependent epimerase/dehydratase family protein n=1 Tax=Luteimonas sp. gir TaxID=3127960 RepID=UPI003075DFE9